MKPPSDDESNRDQLVARAIMGPEFQAAWETLKGSGIGLDRGHLACEQPDPRFPLGIAPIYFWATRRLGLMRIRQGNLIRLASDETEEEWQPRVSGILLSALFGAGPAAAPELYQR